MIEIQEVKVSAIVAMAENRVIGINNTLPWHIPEDLKRFKEITLGKPCIMGRKTFDSILDQLGKPLPKRASVVVSRSNKTYDFEDVHSVQSLEEAITLGKNLAVQNGQDEIMITGGSQIYEQSMPFLDRLYLTIVKQSIEGDAFFPEINQDNWTEINREDHPDFSFITLDAISV